VIYPLLLIAYLVNKKVPALTSIFGSLIVLTQFATFAYTTNYRWYKSVLDGNAFDLILCFLPALYLTQLYFTQLLFLTVDYLSSAFFGSMVYICGMVYLLHQIWIPILEQDNLLPCIGIIVNLLPILLIPQYVFYQRDLEAFLLTNRLSKQKK